MEALEQQVFSLLLKHQGNTEYYDQFMDLEIIYGYKLPFEKVLSDLTWHIDDFFSYYHQVLTNMMREYLIRFDCDVSKFPFRKKLYSCRDIYDTIKSSVMRAFLFGDSNAKTFYQLNGKKFKKFFKFASNIRKFCFHNYLKGKLNVDWIGCLPFLNEIEEMFRIIRCKFSNNFNFSNFQLDDQQNSASNLEAVLFCKRLNLFIVEFDGSDDEKNIEKLKQLYLTQISLQYVNNSSTFSIIMDGKKAIVHVGEFIESSMFYNFACIDHFYTYDLENMMDVIDLSFEIWKYCETKVGNPMVQRGYEKEHKQDIIKESNANKIQKERKENVLTSKVIENLKRLKL